jgi:hypothetical protein
LVSQKFDDEPELRNKIFAIYVYGLTDTCHEGRARLRQLTNLADELGSRSCSHYLTLFGYYIDGAEDLLACFSRNEMIFVLEMRNQFVHGELRSWGQRERTIRWIDNGELRTAKIERDEYWAAFRTVSSGNTDAGLEQCRRKLFDRNTNGPPL